MNVIKVLFVCFVLYDRLGSQHPEEAPPEAEDMPVYPFTAGKAW